MMKKKLRKLAEDIFNLAYVPIWGSEDKELRVQQYEQILKDVEKSGRQKEKQWWREKWQKRNKDIIQHIEQQCKPVPQFDAEKVWELVELYAHNRWQEGRQFGPNDNSVMSCDDFHNRAEYYGRRLLTALGVEDLS